MNCKSCQTILPQDATYCPACGSKIVTGRLSLHGTWTEFIGPFFNWDNFFWRTFLQLFTKPEEVLGAYVSGARKKYFHPFSYLIIYGTIAVLFLKLLPMDWKEMEAQTNQKPEFDMTGFMETYTSYYNFFMIGTIPLFAWIGWIIFRKFRHNFAEHLVFNSYIQAQVGYLTLITQLILYNILSIDMNTYTIVSMLLSFSYGAYAFSRLYQLSLGKTLVYTLIFIGMLLIFLFLVILFGTIIALSLGK